MYCDERSQYIRLNSKKNLNYSRKYGMWINLINLILLLTLASMFWLKVIRMPPNLFGSVLTLSLRPYFLSCDRPVFCVSIVEAKVVVILNHSFSACLKPYFSPESRDEFLVSVGKVRYKGLPSTSTLSPTL